MIYTSRRSRARRTAVALAVTALAATLGTVFAAYSATTTNPGNTLSTGTVAISDNDGGTAALYTAAIDGNTRPGQTVTKCIIVTYTGTLPAVVKLYSQPVTTGGAAFDLTIDAGTGGGAFPSCAGFTQQLRVFDGTLAGVPVTAGSAVSTKALDAVWTTGEVRAFRFTLTTRDDTTANNRTAVLTTTTHAFTWQAESS